MRIPHLIAVTWMAIAIALGCIGCSGPENTDPGAAPGEEGIRDVVSVYTQALAEGDGQRACSLMSATAQQRIITRTDAGDCLAAVKALQAGLSEDAVKALREVEVTEVGNESAEAATITVSFPAAGMSEATTAVGGSSLHVVRVDARWGIDTA